MRQLIFTISTENTEKALLVSLIVVLGVIMYMKLIRSLKKKRLNETYSSIDGYDIENDHLVIRYTIPTKLKSSFEFRNESGVIEQTYDISQSEGGNHEFRTPLSDFKTQLLVLSFETQNQKITKKIRLNIQPLVTRS